MSQLLYSARHQLLGSTVSIRRANKCINNFLQTTLVKLDLLRDLPRPLNSFLSIRLLYPPSCLSVSSGVGRGAVSFWPGGKG